MLLSVIIPAFNCETSIKRTVNSIISAGLKDYEIVIVNDGSFDNTAGICKSLCKEYGFIQYFEQQNSGVSATRNKGIGVSKGEYIMFFDADDTAEENGFSECVDILEKEKPDILVFGMRFDYYKNGKIYRNDKLVPEQSGMLNKNQIRAELDSFYNTNSLASSCNKFYKRALIIDNNILFNTNYFLMEDFLFSLECLKVCENIYCLPKALYYYRQSENEKNAFNRLKRIDDLCEYVFPFKKAINELAVDEIGDSVFNNFFFMLLSQKMYYSNRKQIKKIAESFKNNKLFTEINQGKIPERYISFFNDIKEERYLKIRLLNLKTQARHKVAVLVKSIVRR
ncbi:MAG: glycosyltransferase family 2 protein [Clostridia bacterium]|nr:glycosyltransferase family 2 protein [Clostridia bacterium]MBQ8766765.1 glycosyltransferase family 2 protein [Clostridia bacterium]